MEFETLWKTFGTLWKTVGIGRGTPAGADRRRAGDRGESVLKNGGIGKLKPIAYIDGIKEHKAFPDPFDMLTMLLHWSS